MQTYNINEHSKAHLQTILADQRAIHIDCPNGALEASIDFIREELKGFAFAIDVLRGGYRIEVHAQRMRQTTLI